MLEGWHNQGRACRRQDQKERAGPCQPDKDFGFYSLQSVMESYMKVLSKRVLRFY